MKESTADIEGRCKHGSALSLCCTCRYGAIRETTGSREELDVVAQMQLTRRKGLVQKRPLSKADRYMEQWYDGDPRAFHYHEKKPTKENQHDHQ